MLKYAICKFKFQTPVRFGTKNLLNHQNTFYADTLFSALCNEADSIGKFAEFMQYFTTTDRENAITFSDAFPFVKENLFLPKPAISPNKAGEQESDSVAKKQFKKLNYVSLGNYLKFFEGTLDVEKENIALSNLGRSDMQTRVNIIRDQVTATNLATPYRVSKYIFNDNAGLYVILHYPEQAEKLLQELLTSLGYTGIGGKRSSGLGKFSSEFLPLTELTDAKKIVSLLENRDSAYQVTLSVALPTENELESTLTPNARYQIIKRSGFAYRGNKKSETFKRNDIYAIKAGAVFNKRFDGTIKTIGTFADGTQVQRYLKPLFLGVAFT